MDVAHRHAEADLRAGAFGGTQQDLVQLQSRQRAKRRHPLVTEQELVLDDQPPAGVEQAHVVIAKTGREDLVENAERVVDAECIGGLAKADSGNIEGRPPLDEDDLHAPSREGCGSGQSADSASHHQNASNVAHDKRQR